jgi:hypothetical protein
MTGGSKSEAPSLKVRQHPAHRPFHRGFDDPAGEYGDRKADRAQVASFKSDISSAATVGRTISTAAACCRKLSLTGDSRYKRSESRPKCVRAARARDWSDRGGRWWR